MKHLDNLGYTKTNISKKLITKFINVKHPILKEETALNTKFTETCSPL